MRKHKTVKIDNREIAIKELRVRDILDIFNAAGKSTEGAQDDLALFMGIFREHLPKVTDVAPEDLLELAPSEIKVLLAAFEEVNEDFFGLARRLGIDQILVRLREAILADFSALAADFFRQATGGESGTTGSASS